MTRQRVNSMRVAQQIGLVSGCAPRDFQDESGHEVLAPYAL